jgi:methylated-DNA-[protein]-cysteine S-methyltransferase
MATIMILQTTMSSPIDDIIIQATPAGVSYVGFYPVIQAESIPLSNVTNQAIITCVTQLNEYFEKKRTAFDIPLDVQGTVFQHGVWQALVDVPFGTTQSYGYIANVLNNPKAVRAVGAANGKNPISIIVPCHRIIGANKTLTGYAGGLKRKQWLLAHEGIKI